MEKLSGDIMTSAGSRVMSNVPAGEIWSRLLWKYDPDFCGNMVAHFCRNMIVDRGKVGEPRQNYGFLAAATAAAAT